MAVKKGELHYTKDSGAWQKREWKTAAAKLEGGRVRATLPEGTAVYYLSITDERRALVSTEHEVIGR